MKTVNVTFKTLTPIYFGNANQDFNAIRPSEILGCMRFWLDVASVGMGLEKNIDQIDKNIKASKTKNKIKININETIVKKLLANPKYISWNEMISEELERHFRIKRWSDLLFGCEEFKGQITIEKIEKRNNISLIRNSIKIEIPGSRGWFIPSKLYMGEFAIKFKVNEIFLESIFYPLLYFINEVGYLGGKWNIGFGRVEVISIKDESSNQEVDLKKYYRFAKCIVGKSSEDYIKKHFEYITEGKNNNKGKVVKFITNKELEPLRDRNIKEYIEEKYCLYITDALKEKIKYRNKIREKADNQIKEKEEIKNLRHKVFGTTSSRDTQGTKILPYVGRDVDGKLKAGFLLLDGLYALKGGANRIG